MIAREEDPAEMCCSVPQARLTALARVAVCGVYAWPQRSSVNMHNSSWRERDTDASFSLIC